MNTPEVVFSIVGAVIFVVVGGFIGSLVNGHVIAGAFLGFFFGPLGWLIVALLPDTRPRCPKCKAVVSAADNACPDCKTALPKSATPWADEPFVA
jgi:hypothetical protein